MKKQNAALSPSTAAPVVNSTDALYAQIQEVLQQAPPSSQAQRQPGHGAGLLAGRQTDRGA